MVTRVAALTGCLTALLETVLFLTAVLLLTLTALVELFTEVLLATELLISFTGFLSDVAGCKVLLIEFIVLLPLFVDLTTELGYAELECPCEPEALDLFP